MLIIVECRQLNRETDKRDGMPTPKASRLIRFHCINIYSLGSTGNGMCTCESMYIGDRCEKNLILVVVPTLLAAIVVVSAVITLITLLLVYVIRRERYKAALANNDWKIEYNQVHFTDADDGKSFRSLMSMQSQIKRNKYVLITHHSKIQIPFNHSYL